MPKFSTINSLAITLTVIAFFCCKGFGQGVTIGSNNPPDASAVLDLQSAAGGFALPRLTTAQRNAIVNPVNGLQVYNTDVNCVQIYMPLSGWRDFICDCQSPPSSAFTFPQNIYQGGAASFQAVQGGMNYSWTFAGGTPATASVQNPSVTWASAGTYIVSLTVTDQIGCNTTTIDTITVSNCPPPGQNTVTFNYTGSVQTWTVPSCATSVTIEAYGAQGGSNGGSYPGGLGAKITGTFSVTPGQVLSILVGGQGQNVNCTNCAGGGGGGSFVTLQNNTPLIIAGGGGGRRDTGPTGYISNSHGSSGTSGQSSYDGSGSGGSAGNGGNSGEPSGGGTGGPGGGLLTDGGPCGSQGGGPGQAYVNGGAGGALCNSNQAGSGGFGGGGGATWCYRGTAGGGGGYSGGGTGVNDSGAGGGGSYNAGTNQNNQGAYQAGNGQVIIIY